MRAMIPKAQLLAGVQHLPFVSAFPFPLHTLPSTDICLYFTTMVASESDLSVLHSILLLITVVFQNTNSALKYYGASYSVIPFIKYSSNDKIIEMKN